MQQLIKNNNKYASSHERGLQKCLRYKSEPVTSWAVSSCSSDGHQCEQCNCVHYISVHYRSYSHHLAAKCTSWISTIHATWSTFHSTAASDVLVSRMLWHVVFNFYLCCCSNFFWWKYLNFFGLMPYAFNRSSDIVGSFVSLFFFFFLLLVVLCVLVLLVLSGAILDSSTLTWSFVRFLCAVTSHVTSAAEVTVSVL